MTNVGTIELLGIRAIGRHGVLAEEQHRAQPFEVDVRLSLDVSTAAATDQLEDTIDYGLLAEAVVRTVELSSVRLIERLADRIASICLASGPVLEVEVTVRKLRPPVPLHIATVGITLRRSAAAQAEVAATDVAGTDVSAVEVASTDVGMDADVPEPVADAPLG